MRKQKLSTTPQYKQRSQTNPRRYWVFIALMCFSSAPAIAQQVSEKEVGLQGKFIDANREQLLGNYAKAIEIYESILKEAPQNDAAAYQLAKLYDAQSDGEKAIRYARQAIQLANGNPWYRRFLSELYQKQNRNREAAEVYAELVRQDPNVEEYYYRWAYFLVKSNDVNAALKVYDDFEKRFGINEEVIRRKHSLYAGQGNNRKATDELLRLIKAFPKSLEYRYWLANFYEQIGETILAQGIYADILKIAPNDPKANMALAGATGRQSDEVQLLRSLQGVFEKTDIGIDLKISRLMPFVTKVADTGNKEIANVALELTRVLEAVHPQEAKVYAVTADLLYYSGDRLRALEKYKKTLELDDTVFLVWEQTLRICYEIGDYTALRRYSENAMDLFPNKAFIYYMNGLANARLNHWNNAQESLEQAAMMAANNGRLLFDIQFQRALVLNELKRYDAANEAFEATLKLNAKSPEALNAYAQALAGRGENLEKAKAMAKQAMELNSKNATYQATYGWVLYKLKDYNEAKKWLDKALETSNGNDPGILEHYGDLLFQLNDQEGAVRYWIKAQEKGGGSELLEKKITTRRLYE